MLKASKLFLIAIAAVMLSACIYVPAHETGDWHWHRCDYGYGCHHW
jgi:hypothetical protein